MAKLHSRGNTMFPNNILSPKELVRAAERLGFVFVRQKGSHRVYWHETYNKTICITITGKHPQGNCVNALREVEAKEREKVERLKNKEPKMADITPQGHTRPVDKPPVNTETPVQQTFAQWAKSVRARDNISQKDLGLLLGCSNIDISHLENGHKVPEWIIDKYHTLFVIPNDVARPVCTKPAQRGSKCEVTTPPEVVVDPMVQDPSNAPDPAVDTPDTITQAKAVRSHHETLPPVASDAMREIYVEEAVKILNNQSLSGHDVKLLVALLRANAGAVLGF